VAGAKTGAEGGRGPHRRVSGGPRGRAGWRRIALVGVGRGKKNDGK
jgi:hypothetical protein